MGNCVNTKDKGDLNKNKQPPKDGLIIEKKETSKDEKMTND